MWYEHAMDPDNLRAVPLFSTMEEPDLKKIATFASEDSVPAGATLMREGDYSNEMVAIESGTADVIQEGETVAVPRAGRRVRRDRRARARAAQRVDRRELADAAHPAEHMGGQAPPAGDA